jgi:hypothetical protein
MWARRYCDEGVDANGMRGEDAWRKRDDQKLEREAEGKGLLLCRIL